MEVILSMWNRVRIHTGRPEPKMSTAPLLTSPHHAMLELGKMEPAHPEGVSSYIGSLPLLGPGRSLP